MNSPSTRSSPSYKNMFKKNQHSPVELKEKMRKDYKNRLQNCRNMLLNRIRGTEAVDICEKLTEIYKSMFDFSNEEIFDDEEKVLFESIKNEIVQEEYNWWIAEYEKSNLEHVDWSQVEQDNNVICPICQKTNLLLQNNCITCITCQYKIENTMTLCEVKELIFKTVEKHESTCNNKIQFTLVGEVTDVHIYLICHSCQDMQLIF